MNMHLLLLHETFQTIRDRSPFLSGKHYIGYTEIAESMTSNYSTSTNSVMVDDATNSILFSNLIPLTISPCDSTNFTMINYPNEFIVSLSLAHFAESKRSKIRFCRHGLSDIEIFSTNFLSSFVFLDHVDLTSPVMIIKYVTDLIPHSYSLSSQTSAICQ